MFARPRFLASFCRFPADRSPFECPSVSRDFWLRPLTPLLKDGKLTLMRFWFSKKKRKARHESTLSRIEALGFRVQDVGGLHNGKVADERYMLTDPNGEPFNNLGDGFPTIYEAYKAAREWTPKK